MQIDVSDNEAETVARLLRNSADKLYRRHPSDGLFQNAYTAAECVSFKVEADKRIALADRIQQSLKETKA